MGSLNAKLIASALYSLIRYVLSVWSAEDSKRWIDNAILDPIEDKYQSNATAMALIGHVRSACSIPDDIGGDED